jgi:4-alpha-glucanotransferase
VPSGSTPADGVYVRYPWRDLLNVLALEVDRAGAFAVGEDLGTVEDEAREALAAWRVLSYRLVWFEPRPPAEWPVLALAAVTTHDLPTVSGVWTGADLAARRSLGPVDEEAEGGLRAKLEAVCDSSELEVGEAVRRTYAALSAAPSLLVTATLDDALEVDERPNMPGTLDEWPNWSMALPAPLEEIEEDERVRAVAEVVGRDR